MIYFRMAIEPVPKARPRFTRSGHAYTPQKTRVYEEDVKFAFLASSCEKLPVYDKGIPLIVEATFAKSVPKSYSKKVREQCLAGEILPTKKPDIDNYLKAVLDSVNDGYAYCDDAQIVQTTAQKIYAEEPYVEVKIWSVDEYYRMREE